MHVLHAKRAAVGAPQDRQDVAQAARSRDPAHSRGRSDGRNPPSAEAVGGRIQLRGVAGRDRQAEGSSLAFRWPRMPIGADHHDRAQGIQGAGAHLVRARADGARCAIERCSLVSTAGHRPSMAGSQSGRGSGSAGAPRAAVRRLGGPRRRRRRERRRTPPGRLDRSRDPSPIWPYRSSTKPGVAAIEKRGLGQESRSAVPRRLPWL